MTSKTDLRIRLRNLRHEFVLQNNISEISSQSVCIAPLLDFIARARCLACYHDVKGEAGVMPLAEYAARHNVRTALPWLPPTDNKDEARKAGIIFRRWSPGDPLQQTALGFYQPIDDAATLTPDLILTPLVGFDRALNRLGQGAGHYDRVFQNWPDAIRVGVAWSVQEVDHLPVDPWDVPLDAIITEREWILGSKSRIEK